MVSRFPAGSAPVRRGWRGSTCAGCVQRALSTRLDGLGEKERRAVIREEVLADPSAPIGEIAKRLGIARSLAVSVKRSMVQAGEAEWANPPKPTPSKPRAAKPPQPPANTTRPKAKTTSPGDRAGERRDAMLAALRDSPDGLTAAEAARHLPPRRNRTRPERAAARILDKLVSRGLAYKQPGTGNRWGEGRVARWTAVE